MRIISKLKDYYDNAMQHGIDMTTVFVRNAEQLEIKTIPEKVQKALGYGNPQSNHRSKGRVRLDYARNIIVFCGKTYHSITVQRSEERLDCPARSKEITDTKVFYDFNEMAEFFAKDEIDISEAPQYPWSYRYNEWATMKAFLAEQGTTELADFCIENRYVTLTMGDMAMIDERQRYNQKSTQLIANGYLDKFQFYRVFNSFLAFQEIDMYVSGTLPQSTAMPIQISDKDRIAQHGFDKYSFRKSPQK